MGDSSKSRRRDRIIGTLAALLLLLAIPLGLFIASNVLEKAVPDNPITGRQEALASSPMLVSPETKHGNDGASDNQPDNSDEEDEEN